jgi:hypothetical protein
VAACLAAAFFCNVWSVKVGIAYYKAQHGGLAVHTGQRSRADIRSTKTPANMPGDRAIILNLLAAFVWEISPATRRHRAAYKARKPVRDVFRP